MVYEVWGKEEFRNQSQIKKKEGMLQKPTTEHYSVWRVAENAPYNVPILHKDYFDLKVIKSSRYKKWSLPSPNLSRSMM